MNARTKEEWYRLSMERAATVLVQDMMHEVSRELRDSIPDVQEIMSGADLSGYLNYDIPGQTFLLDTPMKMLLLHHISRTLERMVVRLPEGGEDVQIKEIEVENLFAFLLKSFDPKKLAVWTKDVSLRSHVSFTPFPKTPSMKQFAERVYPYLRALI